MSMLTIKNCSSLEKILPVSQCLCKETNSGSCLLNEEFSWQIAYKAEEYNPICVSGDGIYVEIDSDIAEYVSVFKTKCVPVMRATNDNPDAQYITADAGFIPDVLEPYTGCIGVSNEVYRSIWISVKPGKKVKPGKHTVKVNFKFWNEIVGISEFILEVIGKALPELDIPNTNWFHSDCIATIHDCKVFSRKHWSLIDKYMKMASEHGVNMMLTPIVTPALDTKKGAERPTVQLVDISYESGKYSFGFEKLDRWLKLCRKNGIKYIEVAHLFSQWGGENTPKVVVKENGKEIKKFGWHTDALSEDYKEFLKQFVPAVANHLSENWDKEKIYFHLCDEPAADHIEHYSKLYELVKPLISGFRQMDALSSYEFYKKGCVDVPVVNTPHAHDFLGKGISEVWVYTCCCPHNYGYSNRFIAMPSWRNRILGLQMYKFDVKGFLHWGYNFYYSRLSIHPINPYINNDAEGAFPAGDGFGVYPVPEGCIPSIRYKVFNQGLQDMMAAKLLEALAGKDEVMKLVESEGKVDFNICPENAEFILNAREKINRKIKEYIEEK